MLGNSPLFEQKKPEKFYPEVGTPLYLQQSTGNGWVDMCKYPYTVIAVSKSHITIQRAKLIFNGPQYYDTVADDIQPDPFGEILELSWAPKKGRWQIDRYKTGYPQIAYFGQYMHQPYLN